MVADDDADIRSLISEQLAAARLDVRGAGDIGEIEAALLEQFGRRAELSAAFPADAETHRRERTEHHSAVLAAIDEARWLVGEHPLASGEVQV